MNSVHIYNLMIYSEVSQPNYNPFGMVMPGRNDPGGNDYRYGFNGMESDDEVTDANGQRYDFGARFYNPRVGRWLSRYPVENLYPNISPHVTYFREAFINQTKDPQQSAKDGFNTVIYNENKSKHTLDSEHHYDQMIQGLSPFYERLLQEVIDYVESPELKQEIKEADKENRTFY